MAYVPRVQAGFHRFLVSAAQYEADLCLGHRLSGSDTVFDQRPGRVLKGEEQTTYVTTEESMQVGHCCIFDRLAGWLPSIHAQVDIPVLEHLLDLRKVQGSEWARKREDVADLARGGDHGSDRLVRAHQHEVESLGQQHGVAQISDDSGRYGGVRLGETL